MALFEGGYPLVRDKVRQSTTPNGRQQDGPWHPCREVGRLHGAVWAFVSSQSSAGSYRGHRGYRDERDDDLPYHTRYTLVRQPMTGRASVPPRGWVQCDEDRLVPGDCWGHVMHTG